MNQKEGNNIYKFFKMIFWDMPVGLNKLGVSDYGFLGLLLGICFYVPFLGLFLCFLYLFQTDNFYIPTSLMRLLEAYLIIPSLVYFLWRFTGHLLEKKYPKIHRFSVRRWSELLVVFIYFNTIIGIMLVYFRWY